MGSLYVCVAQVLLSRLLATRLAAAVIESAPQAQAELQGIAKLHTCSFAFEAKQRHTAYLHLHEP